MNLLDTTGTTTRDSIIELTEMDARYPLRMETKKIKKQYAKEAAARKLFSQIQFFVVVIFYTEKIKHSVVICFSTIYIRTSLIAM